MPIIFSVAFVPLFLSFSFSAPWPDLSVAAPSQNPHPGDAAVVVGVERYAFVPSVPGAARGAEDWQLFLTKTRGLPAEKVRLIRDNEATLEELRDAAAWAAGAVEPGGTLWFVFIGHGAPGKDGKEGILVGVDAQQRAASLFARSLGQGELLGLLGKGKQGKTVAILDACFSGRTAEGAALVPGLQPLIAVQAAGALPANAVVLTAGKADQFAGPLPGSERPAFSYLLLGALRGWGDSDGDGSVTAAEAVDYAKRALQALLRDRRQTPESNGSVSGVLSSGAKEAGPDLAAMARAARPVADISFGKAEVLSVPKLPKVEGVAGGYRDVDVELEQLLEEAVTLERSKTSSAFDKMEAWCRLAGAKKDNPYAAKSKEACGLWESYADREFEQRLRLLDDYASLQGYLGLKLKSAEQKMAALDAFLTAYKSLAGELPVVEAKKAKGELASGNGPVLPSILALDKPAGALPVPEGLAEKAFGPIESNLEAGQEKCRQGDAKSCSDLANLFLNKDWRRAAALYEFACRLGVGGADCEQGAEAFKDKGYDALGGLHLLALGCARRADYRTCRRLVEWSSKSQYGTTLPAEVFPRVGLYLQAACLKGASAICEGAGYAFYQGFLARNWPRAKLLYGLACRAKDPNACSEFQNLDGKEREGSRVERWIGGDSEALPELERRYNTPSMANNLAYCRADRKKCRSLGLGLMNDRPYAAVEVHRIACDAGEFNSCLDLARAHEQGWGPLRSPAQALFWHEKACGLNYWVSCETAAKAYKTGAGVERSLSKAFEFQLKGCGLSPAACQALGLMHVSGEGTEKSEERAREIWQTACRTGNAPYSCFELVGRYKDAEALKQLKSFCRKVDIEWCRPYK